MDLFSVSKLSSKISLGTAITFGIMFEITKKINVFIRTRWREVDDDKSCWEYDILATITQNLYRATENFRPTFIHQHQPLEVPENRLATSYIIWKHRLYCTVSTFTSGVQIYCAHCCTPNNCVPHVHVIAFQIVIARFANKIVILDRCKQWTVLCDSYSQPMHADG